jgi:hypothetical protein
MEYIVRKAAEVTQQVGKQVLFLLVELKATIGHSFAESKIYVSSSAHENPSQSPYGVYCCRVYQYERMVL